MQVTLLLSAGAQIEFFKTAGWKKKKYFAVLSWESEFSDQQLLQLLLLVRQVNAQFGWRDKVFPGALCDHHTCLLVEHGSYLRWGLRYWQILSHLRISTVLKVIGDIAILSQEWKQLQQKVAEVFADAKPPCQKMR